MVILDQRAEREDTIATAIQQNTNLAVAYEEHMVRTLKGLDGALLFMRHEYQRLNRKLDINRYIDEGIVADAHVMAGEQMHAVQRLEQAAVVAGDGDHHGRGV